ncbi:MULTISPECIES: DUF5949 family protein [Streptomyces]|uniref:Uncharacterized protein n=1 Tax=Streptomyces prasinus TaxID=67345 RepID=A0ABX6B6W9_9ACTN|nr:DUF5949 family protein [Streptomyces prasinus]QEV09834.1 hypothetical protein CP972_33280 [Streptomyces prasinus]
MSTISTAARPGDSADPGSVAVMAWHGEAPDGGVPYLLACSLGDGSSGPDATADAVRRLLRGAGLSPTGHLVDATGETGPSGVVFVPGAASLALPGFDAQFVPPPKWTDAAGERGYVYLVFTTRPWPSGAEPGDLATLDAFASDRGTLRSAAHVLLPARTLRTG